MAELADASDSKSGVHYGRIGSTPITAIIMKRSNYWIAFFFIFKIVSILLYKLHMNTGIFIMLHMEVLK